MPDRGPARPGTVYLVGWGPGDPDLATVRARRLAGLADLTVAPRTLEPALEQAGLEGRRLLADSPRALDEARTVAAGGGRVAWLFRGDPVVDGGALDLARDLLARGVTVEMVPGVPRLTAAAVQSGAAVVPPLTLAGEAVAGPGPGSLLLPLTGPPDAMAGELLAAGWPPETPALLVRAAGTPRQGQTGHDLAGLAREGGGQVPPAPAVLILAPGSLAPRAGLEGRPLHGRTIAVTRPPQQAGEMAAWLQEAGARVLLWPTIDIEPVTEPGPIDRALAALERTDWVVFTSANGVKCFFERLHERGRDARALGRARVAAIGPATGEALSRRGIRPDLVPGKYQAEGLLDALGEADLSGRRVLIARAEKARDILPETLRRRGAEVEVLVVYRAVAPELPADAVARELRSGRVDAVTFTSSSTVSRFADRLGRSEAPALVERGAAAVACIGPITAATARELGFRVAVEAEAFTVPDLVAALARHFASP